MARTSTGKRRKGKKRSPKRSPPTPTGVAKRVKRAKPKPTPTGVAKRGKPKPTPTGVAKRGKPKPKRKPKPSKRSSAAKRGWAKRRARQRQSERERDSDLGDVEVPTGGYDDYDDDYEPYPTPTITADRDDPIEFEAAAEAFERMRHMGDHAMEAYGEIEWFPRFDEVYDYIDALVDEFDLDAHELFEMAFGYSDEAAA